MLRLHLSSTLKLIIPVQLRDVLQNIAVLFDTRSLMPEADTIHPDALPLTVDSLAEQFAACGLAAGQTVLVHTSMSRIGWIVGGAETVIRALLRVLTPEGTLMMPAFTTSNTD